MQTFTDLVGAAVVPAHCFDTTELTDLTPALDTATAAHDMGDQAREASISGILTACDMDCAFDCS